MNLYQFKIVYTPSEYQRDHEGKRAKIWTGEVTAPHQGLAEVEVGSTQEWEEASEHPLEQLEVVVESRFRAG